jgi:hypothetical protein
MATSGILIKRWSDKQPVASIGPEGVWYSPDRAFAAALNSNHKPIPTEAGEDWMIAFYAAVKAIAAEVVQRPAPDDDGWPGMR